MSSLIKKIRSNYNIISIIGMSKNAGKTTALNYLISEANEENAKIGLVSIGRDGEAVDVVSETEKPRIYLNEGALFVTSTKLLELSDAVVEILKVCDYNTPLGNVVISRVCYSGNVQISGPQTLKETREVVDMMLEYGADFVIVDGALNRMTSAAPEICQCAILSTGASLGGGMTNVVKETAHVANLFNLPRIEEYREIVEEIFWAKDFASIDYDGSIRRIEIKTSLNSAKAIAENITENTKYMVISGALTRTTLVELLKLNPRINEISFVVNNATKIFVDSDDYRIFMLKGINILVLNNIDLLAITTNPYSTKGYNFDAFEFKKAMQESAEGLMVIDVMTGV